MLRSDSLRLTVVLVLVATLAAAAAPPADAGALAESTYSRAGWPTLGGLSPSVFDLALSAASCAVESGVVARPETLTVIDYSLPSTAKRMWVYDLDDRKVLYHELVAHGSGTGDNFARAFSNTADSHQSSLGLYVTDQPYVGKNGYSLRMDGLEAGFNDRARDRAIVIHGAPYVNDSVARTQGRLGRSWGCPAVRAVIAKPLIDRVRGGGLVFVYYPDPTWLAESRFLTCERAK